MALRAPTLLCRLLFAALPAALGLAACSAPSGLSEGADGSARGFTASGQIGVQWQVEPHPLPENEPFELVVHLTRAGRPLRGAQLFVSAWMPDHGHGMLREPRAEETSPGTYRVRGMLLHMGGRWELLFDIVHAGLAERARFELEL